MKNSIFQYFNQGFFLTNRSLDLFIVTVIFGSLLYLPNLNEILQISLVHILLFIIFVGFNLSLPVFLVWKQQKQKLDYIKILKVVTDSSMRILIPGIILFVILIVLFIVSMMFVGLVFHPSTAEVTEFFQNISKTEGLLIAVPLIALLTPVSLFTAFFFSLENKGFFRSIKSSLVFSFKNLYFVGILILIYIIYFYLVSFLPKDFWGQVILTVLGGYVTLFLTATTLYYYQAKIKPVSDSGS